ncbi:Wzz/FepE/Etk N-terminal domain-containing protein [Ferruginibacter albus]|uniref:Wzz/FepE/Etk N-terminal domain-containing protein n=1 Tax=Ferruginibacter albus TaxID=2875540 RepID=UPI001CC668C7|nr:Wzz/FepE/Etk N-terminal domain-containing protein [Ferruginibacter albus]UAY52253.1 hypothetical protein K9M53_00830 [Ferruginibacter albus]
MERNSNSFIVSKLAEIKNFIVKKIWLFLAVGLISAIGGIVYASLKKPAYQSNLVFALDDGGAESGLSGALSLAAQFGVNLGGDGKNVFIGDNILEIMKSRRIVESVLLSVDTFDNKPYTMIGYYFTITDYKKSAKGNAANVDYLPGITKENLSYLQDSILLNTYNIFVRDYITAERPDRKLNIYNVNVTSLNEKFTKDFTDKLITKTNEFYVDICSKKSRQTLEILEDRVAYMKGNMDQSISNKADIQDANLNPAFSKGQVPVLKQQLNMQTYGGAYAELFKNLELARYQYLKQIPLMQIIDGADYPMKRIKMSRLKMAVLFAFLGVAILSFIFWFMAKSKTINDYSDTASGKNE